MRPHARCLSPRRPALAPGHGSTTSAQHTRLSHKTRLQQAEGDLGQEYQAVGLEEAPRDPRVHRETEASPEILDALGLVVERRLAREDCLEEEPVTGRGRGAGGKGGGSREIRTRHPTRDKAKKKNASAQNALMVFSREGCSMLLAPGVAPGRMGRPPELTQGGMASGARSLVALLCDLIGVIL